MNKRYARKALDRASGICELCQLYLPLQLHHRIPRGMGGRRRTKVTHDHPDNLHCLCLVCHAASHGEMIILGDHSCRTCWRRAECSEHDLCGTFYTSSPAGFSSNDPSLEA